MPSLPRAEDQTQPAVHGELPRWAVDDLPGAARRSPSATCSASSGRAPIMAATSIGGGEWLVGPAAAVKYSSIDLPDRDRGDRAAGRLQPGGHSLHALHWRADLRRNHAAQTGPAILGRASTPCSDSSSWDGRRWQAVPRPRCWGPGWDGCQARPISRARMGGHGSHRGRGAHPLFRRNDRAHARVLRLDDARRSCSCSSSWSTSHSCRWRTGHDVRRLLQLRRPAAPYRLGAHRRARRHRGLRRHRQSDGHELGSRQGLRHGRRRSARSRVPSAAMPSSSPMSGKIFRRPETIWPAGASGCGMFTPTRSGSGDSSASSACS